MFIYLEALVVMCATACSIAFFSSSVSAKVERPLSIGLPYIAIRSRAYKLDSTIPLCCSSRKATAKLWLLPELFSNGLNRTMPTPAMLPRRRFSTRRKYFSMSSLKARVSSLCSISERSVFSKVPLPSVSFCRRTRTLSASINALVATTQAITAISDEYCVKAFNITVV